MIYITFIQLYITKSHVCNAKKLIKFLKYFYQFWSSILNFYKYWKLRYLLHRHLVL